MVVFSENGVTFGVGSESVILTFVSPSKEDLSGVGVSAPSEIRCGNGVSKEDGASTLNFFGFGPSFLFREFTMGVNFGVTGLDFLTLPVPLLALDFALAKFVAVGDGLTTSRDTQRNKLRSCSFFFPSDRPFFLPCFDFSFFLSSLVVSRYSSNERRL